MSERARLPCAYGRCTETGQPRTRCWVCEFEPTDTETETETDETKENDP